MSKSTGFLLAAGIAAVSLTGCTAAAAACTPEWSPGGLAEAVSAEGPFGEAVTVSFPLPLAQGGEATTAVLERGDGALVRADQFVDASITIVDGKTGEAVESGTVSAWAVGTQEPRLTTAIECQTVGSRVVAVGPASELIGPDLLAENSLAYEPDSTLVYVIDITAAYLARADGAPQLPQNGLPTISLAPDGRPGFTFTQSPAPEELRISVLKAGSGPVVEEGDTVMLHYTGVSWDTRKVFDSSWERGQPTAFVAADGTSTSGGVIPGFAQALIGQRVGSQVLVSIPVDLAYPIGAQVAVAGQPLLFVFDVLGIQEDG